MTNEATLDVVSRLQCRACGAKYIGEPLLRWPASPSCDVNALVLIDGLDLAQSWWHLLPKVEVV